MSLCLASLVLGASLQSASPAAIAFAGVLNNNSNSEATRWRSPGTAKTMDVDSNSIYGSLGAVIWGDGGNAANHSTPAMFISGTNGAETLGWTLVGQTVNPDVGLGTQSFIHSQYTPMDNLGGSAQIVHGVTSISSSNGTVTIRLNGATGDYTGRTVRLGLIQDYQEPTAVNDVSKMIMVIQTAGVGGGSNSLVRPASRNGTPDIYFFDLTSVVPGDQFTVACYTNPASTSNGGLASIGTMFLDISGGGQTNPPALTNQLSIAPTNVLMSGYSFTLSIGATGTAPMAYLWRRSGAIVSNTAVAGVTFANVTTNLSGNYDVIVSNSFGSVTSAPVAVTVLSPGTNLTTFGRMFNEMTDRDSLATWPGTAYVARMVSSTDPRDPGASLTGRPAGHKNVDWSNFQRWETNGTRREWVLMDLPGPGVLTRWWSGGYPELANCRIYLDHSTNPVFAGNLSLTELVTNQFATLFGSAFAFEAARGINSYVPMPFQQRLKITWDGANPHGSGAPDGSPPSPKDNTTGGLWFNAEYRQYANGTVLETYLPSDSIQNLALVQDTANRLATPVVAGDVSLHTTNVVTLTSGQSVTRTATGPGAIRRIQIHLSAADSVAALANTWIELRFDGYRTVRAPVGPFFGNGRSGNSGTPLNPCVGFMQSVAANGNLTSLWVMPFRNAAEVRVINLGSQSVTLNLQVDSGAWTWDARSMYYHAEFRQEDGVKTQQATSGSNSEGDAMWNFVNLRGRGVLVGDTLSIRNNTGGWWGEGDEKIYVDDDVAPSFSGTGTEDYYGYAWGNDALYQRRFVAQSRGSGNQGAGLNGGVTVNSRLRLLDTIPFTNRLRFDMEVWAWQTGTVDYQMLTHWYGTPGSVALRPVADLGLDFKSAASGQSSQQVGVPDSAGTGTWNYFACSHANPAAAGSALTPLTFGTVGNMSHTAYGGGQALTGVPAANLPAIGRTCIMSSASANVGIQNAPGYHELDFHPGQGLVGSTSQPPFAVARWTCGTNVATAASIEGSLRNLVGSGDSVDFGIYHNGVMVYSLTTSSNKLADTAFNLSRTVKPGDTVDFVIGNNGVTNALGDETAIRAVISLPDVETNNAVGGGVSIGTNAFSYGTIKNVAIANINAAPLLAAASSPNGFPLALIGVSSSNAGASVNLANGLITYAPPLNFVGVDKFQYTVGDGYGNFATGTVTVAVGDTGAEFNRMSISAAGQQVAISFRGVPQHDYAFESTTNLAAANWQPVVTNRADNAGLLPLQAVMAINAMAFFRFRAL